MKPLIGLFKANIHYATMAFVFEGHSAIAIFNFELHPAIEGVLGKSSDHLITSPRPITLT